MRAFRLLIVPLCFALACAVQAQPAGGYPSARDQLQAFSEGLERLGSEFTQTVTGPDGELLERGDGFFYLQRPDLFHWRFEGEFPELIVADGRRLWLYDESLEQVTVKAQPELTADSPLLLLTDPGALDEQFVVTELGPVEGSLLLELRARDPDAGFERVILALRNGTPASMVLEDAFGLRTEIRFKNVVANPELDAALFRFTPPPGVDVVGETEGLDRS